MVAMRVVIAACTGLAALGAALPAVAQDAESQVYAAAKTCDGLRSYLRAYPNGRFKASAEARITKDCVASSVTSESAKSVSVPKTVENRTPIDRCAQARNDWKEIKDSDQSSVLQAFISATPAACNVQRAQAEARISFLAEQKAAREGAAQASYRNRGGDFVGTWKVVSGGSNCTTWDQFAIQDNKLVVFSGNAHPLTLQNISFSVVGTNPPQLLDNDGWRWIIENRRLIQYRPDGSRSPCESLRQ